MIVATWNVNSLTARWPRVEQWLVERAPDVVLLQETKQSDARFPYDGFASLGYEATHHGQGQWNGVAIASRVGLADVVRGFGDGDVEARVISARCGGVRFYSCYVPNGRALDDPHYQYKLRWLSSLTDRLAQRDVNEPVVVGGDFNVAPRDLDVYDPERFIGCTHVSAPEREALGALTGTGLTDLAAFLEPDDVAYTWWDYRNGSFHRGWGLRIDLLLVTADLRAVATRIYVDRDARRGIKPSDHAPVIGEFATT